MIEMMGPWITELEHEYVNDALDNMNGPKKYYYVEKFEEEFAKYCQRKYCLMTPTCTAALHLVLAAWRPYMVSVPDLTWVASAIPLTYVGSRINYKDVLPDTWCIDDRTIGWTDNVIAVDLCGNMPEYDEFPRQGRATVKFIEDAAQGIGSTYNGKPAGSFGWASVFSFHRTKTLSCFEGGALVTDDEDLYRLCKILRYHGQNVDNPLSPTYWAEMIGFKYTPSNISAAMALAQLERIEELVNKKRRINSLYRKILNGLPVQINGDTDKVRSGAWITVIVYDKMSKERMMQELQERNIPSRPMLYPLTQHPAFIEYKASGVNWESHNPVSYHISEHGVMLPCALTMTDEQAEEVAMAVREIVADKENE